MDKETKENRMQFYAFSQHINDRDACITIPARSYEEALRLLAGFTTNPDDWKRERDIEARLKDQYEDREITGKRKGPKPWANEVSGPMYG